MLIIRRQRECAWRDVRCILVCPCLEMSSKKVSVKSQSWNKSSLQMRSDHSWHLRSPRTSRADGRPSKNVWRAARRERLGDETRNDTHLRIWNNITKTAQIFNHGGENRSRSRTGCALQGRHKRSLPVRHSPAQPTSTIEVTNNCKKGPTSTSRSTAHPNNPQTSPASPFPSGSVSWTSVTTCSTPTTCASTESAHTSSCSESRRANPSESAPRITRDRSTRDGTGLLASRR
jgi:hypothetical protein